ncbi:HAMP domain-containing protein [candidate division KSB1 bacterium]|nr:HAMP domain-containing protein [candidate division KSB1 bacterium]
MSLKYLNLKNRINTFKKTLQNFGKAVKIKFSKLMRSKGLEREVKEIKKSMTIKAKISLSIIFALILIVPMVSLSLHYLNEMWKRLEEITLQDTRLVDIAQEIEVQILLAKKAESNLSLNFVMGNDSIYIQQNNQAIDDVVKLVNEGLMISLDDSLLKAIKHLTRGYQQHFNEFIQNRTLPISIERQRKLLNTAFANKKNELFTKYINLMNRAQNEQDKNKADSLTSAANKILNDFSIEDLIFSTHLSENPQLGLIKQRLTNSVENIQHLAQLLNERGQEKLQTHRLETEKFSARAKRNIVTVILLTFMISIYLVFIFPTSIVKPISAIINMVRQAESGNYDVSIPSVSRDEVGELAKFLNRMMRQVKEYDILKTRKIAQQQRKVETIVNAVREGILILNHEREITVINKILQQTTGWGHETIGKPLKKVDYEGELTKLVNIVATLPDNLLERRVTFKNLDEIEIQQMVRLHTLKDEGGNIFCYIAIFLPVEHVKKPLFKK